MNPYVIKLYSDCNEQLIEYIINTIAYTSKWELQFLELQHAATSTVSKKAVLAVLTRANEQHPLPLGALVQVLISKNSSDPLRLMVKQSYMYLKL